MIDGASRTRRGTTSAGTGAASCDDAGVVVISALLLLCKIAKRTQV
jgi:hypothetical protein